MPESPPTDIATPEAPAANSIALVGVGNWGRHILRDLVSLGCEVHVVARSEQSISNAKEFGAASIVGEISELPEVDGAVAAPITTAHSEVIDALAAQQAGPIYVEKPLTSDPATARELAGSLGDRLFVMDKWRYHPGVLELARLARDGELGEVQSVHARRVTDGNGHPDVNTVWTHAPHDLACVLEITGKLPEPKFATGEFVKDELIGLNATFGGPPWFTLEISNAAPAHRREMRVVGSEGSATLDGGWSDEVAVRTQFDRSGDRIIKTSGELPLLAELRAFVGHLNGGPPPKSSALEGAEMVERIAQVIEMAESLR